MFENLFVNSHLTKEFYDRFMDPEGTTDDWVLTSSPYPVACILAVYLLVTLKLGPTYMKHRPAYSLENTMRVYNIAQVFLNAYLVHHILSSPWSCVFNTFCRFEEEMEVCRVYLAPFLEGYWMFQVLKILDLFDTVFIVLRKNDSHLTFLHVYHHVAMVVFTWLSFYYFKTPQGTWQALVNLVVHTVMYGYYFLTTFPALKKYLWWKRHLTKLQLGQFVVVMGYLGYLFCNSCDIPPIFTIMWIINVAVICALFINFYIKSYLAKRK